MGLIKYFTRQSAPQVPEPTQDRQGIMVTPWERELLRMACALAVNRLLREQARQSFIDEYLKIISKL